MRNTPLPFLLLLLALHILLPTISYADLYSWNNEHRPPVSLQEALTISREMLKEHGEIRYCSGVSSKDEEQPYFLRRAGDKFCDACGLDRHHWN